MTPRVHHFSPPLGLVDFLASLGADVFRRWDHVPDGLLIVGCTCRACPAVVLTPMPRRAWLGEKLGELRAGQCSSCGVWSWNRCAGVAGGRRESSPVGCVVEHSGLSPPGVRSVTGETSGRTRRRT